MALQDLTPQLRTRLSQVERLVGIFLIVAVLLMLAGLVYYVRQTAKERGWFVQKIPYYTYVAEVSGIKVGMPVTLMGFTVGEVTKIDPQPVDPWFNDYGRNVFIAFNVRHPYEGYVWTDSRVRVGSGDFLGARTLEITRGVKGIVTVTQAPGEEPRLLSDDFEYKPEITNITYLPLEQSKNGFWVQATESQPLQQRLTDIANTIHQALPGVFALTNEVAAALNRLTEVETRVGATLPRVDATLAELNGVFADLRPVLQAPGGLGTLLVPTNLNQQLMLTLANLDPASGPIALTLSNLNGRMADVGVALSNVNLQLVQNTNLLADANSLTRNVGSLATTIDTLLRRHWLFRSAFRTNTPSQRPPNPPRDLRRY